MDYGSDRKATRNFFITLNLFTGSFSFLIVVPVTIFYVWTSIRLTAEQFAIFNSIWPPMLLFGIAFVLATNWLVLLPITGHLKSINSGTPVGDVEYLKAKQRLLRLPFTYAAISFFRWLVLLGIVIALMTVMADLSGTQIATMWMGAVSCAFVGVFSYFSITEIAVQNLIGSGVFQSGPGPQNQPRLTLLQRLTLLSVSAVLLPVLFLSVFFIITVETAGMGTPFLYGKMAVFVVFSMIIGFFSPALVNKTIRHRTGIVTDFLKRIGDGDLNAVPREVPIQDELSDIIADVDDMKDRLRRSRGELLELNLNLEKKVSERTQDLAAALEELEAANNELEAMNDNLVAMNRAMEEAEQVRRNDMALAASVQASFLPKSVPHGRTLDVAFVYRPWTEVSGDFFDFYEDGGELKGAGLFDVSGHGISSALLTLLVKSIIRRNFYLNRDKSLGTIMDLINDILIAEMGATEQYVTGVLVRFNGDRVEYVNCASPDLLFRSGSTGRVGRVLDSAGVNCTGRFLGVAAMKEPIAAVTMAMERGDCLFFYTDCLAEAKNPRGRSYEETGIMASLQNAPAGTAREMLDHIMNTFNEFREGNPVRDDLTAILIKKN
ncbi:MAG TPA: PP2C family protein-serine/threonine phosphatase [Spirochaetota bacterium]|nr:PP2C family protein-serine/threonine phosphatase [Spirochaetota bacterium]HPC42385.1 PP2C family protein-serine/threonine phosphatase [Spirochaetota bacterium]HPL16397.1 PP2C family protein-serine/threonine phosphatase [Spirochaetota bacterium]HQF08026.1 PP2C family protein-serine/threonine phosphatase [Spirochaetota bacterium]HQH96586.1 PP2C family protein-serine/threonine phosphatase [Spirochaetota bacterium]